MTKTVQKPEFIRLMDAQRTTVLDSVATEYEDSFCLESFGELIEAAENAEPAGTKHFIIARVQTWDHKQPDRAFYSYYHAHHLNKVLFQTQMYLQKKLLHRLRVLNPLTNTDIIGNVLYFMVIGKTQVKSAVEVKPSLETVEPLQPVKKSAEMLTQGGPLKVDTTVPTKTNTEFPLPLSPTVTQLPLGLTSPVDVNRALHHREPEMEKGDDKDHGWTLVSASKDVDTNETLLTSPLKKKRPLFRIRTKFRSQVGPISASAVEGQSPPSTQMPLSAVHEHGPAEPLSPSRQSTLVPPGAVTQHGRALSPEEAMGLVPLTKYGRRRALSYLNAIAASPIHEKIPELQSWQAMVNLDRKSPLKTEPDEVPAFPPAEALFEPRPHTPENHKQENGEEYYEAVLIATDNDFLDLPQVRAIFRENALIKSDAVLFEMPPVTAETLRQREQRDALEHDDNGVAFCCCF